MPVQYQYGLTPRELEVAELRALKLSAKEIATRLGTCEGTVKIQLTSARQRIGARDSKELVTMLAARKRRAELEAIG